MKRKIINLHKFQRFKFNNYENSSLSNSWRTDTSSESPLISLNPDSWFLSRFKNNLSWQRWTAAILNETTLFGRQLLKTQRGAWNKPEAGGIKNEY